MDVQAFLHRLTMKAVSPKETLDRQCLRVFDVLEEQGRRAGLFPAAISGILDQLTVRTDYSALQCDKNGVIKRADQVADDARMAVGFKCK
ncbi:hypothetical protein KIN20_013695 [Parelaphostrongylus tenuis]|uniref:Uncharacterized protein n=1 Tax=Parelaphostrongylus tenuis TaxID=148309 RepID=A0AAD5MXX6_PARTN|nr:hypothetical protein KIN20_013695 [Parelaphostrongylus tenuis]